MEEIKASPSGIESSHALNFLNVIKKRKFQAEQLGLPLPKHKCWERIFPLGEAISMFDEDPDFKNIKAHTMKRKLEGETHDDGSEHESGKGSNSFAGDSDSATSVYVDAKLDPVYEKRCLYDRPTTTSVPCFTSSAEQVKYVTGENQPIYPDKEIQEMQEFQNLEDQLQEFGNEVDFIFPEYGNDCIEQCTESTDKRFEGDICTGGLNPNTYVLSSGRWTVNQDNSEAQSGRSRAPTIDQEFEQYFSTLML